MKRSHQILGYAGLIPFFVFTVEYSVTDKENYALMSLLVYSGLIFSFLAGLLWASTLEHEPPKHVLYVSVSAILLSFTWIFCVGISKQFHSFLLIIISFSFIALCFYERIYLSNIYSVDFLKLRMRLSLSAASILFLASFI